MVANPRRRITRKTSVEIHLLTQDGKRALIQSTGKMSAWDGKLNENVWVLPAGTELEFVAEILTPTGIGKDVMQYTKDDHTEQLLVENIWIEPTNKWDKPNVLETRIPFADNPAQTIRLSTELDPVTGETYQKITEQATLYLGHTRKFNRAFHPDYPGKILVYDVTPLTLTHDNADIGPKYDQNMEFAVVPKPEPFTKKAYDEMVDSMTGELKDLGYPIVSLPITLRTPVKLDTKVTKGRLIGKPMFESYLWVKAKKTLIDRTKPVPVMSLYYPQEISHVKQDGPPGNYSGFATGNEDVPSSDPSREQEAFAALNAFRQAHGKPTLDWHENLARSARYKSATMYVFDIHRKGINGRSHDIQANLNGSYALLETEDRMIRRFLIDTGIRARGSNLAKMPPSSPAADLIYKIWGKSPVGHKETMLDDEATCGAIGYVGGQYTLHLGRNLRAPKP